MRLATSADTTARLAQDMADLARRVDASDVATFSDESIYSTAQWLQEALGVMCEAADAERATPNG